jgi:hypothetical protein
VLLLELRYFPLPVVVLVLEVRYVVCEVFVALLFDLQEMLQLLFNQLFGVEVVLKLFDVSSSIFKQLVELRYLFVEEVDFVVLREEQIGFIANFVIEVINT